MEDYSKLTVVKLKDELKTRGLATTGLKAALVQRLNDDDATKAAVEATSNTKDEGITDVPVADTTIPKLPEPTEASVSAEFTKDDDAPTSLKTEGTVELHAGNEQKIASEDVIGDQNLLDAGSPGASVKPLPIERTPVDTKVDVEETEQEPKEENIQSREYLMDVDTANPDGAAHGGKSAMEEKGRDTTNIPHGSGRAVGNTQAADIPIPTAETQSANLNQHEEAAPQFVSETQTTIATQEVLDDSKKRKRRSRSPVPLTQDIAMKRLRAEESVPSTQALEIFTQSQAQQVASKSPLEAEATLADVVEPAAEAKPTSIAAPSAAPPTDVTESAASPTKPATADARFKNLFTSTNAQATASLDPVHSAISKTAANTQDRDVKAALHPATNALYIGNLMRPLQANILRTHLRSLASRDSSPAEPASDHNDQPDAIQEFFLDSIKSHCLVQFTDIAAASRVRTALHDRIWPDERNRKPLFVDYAPENKMQMWIAAEQEAAGHRPAKRWEVVYETNAKGAVEAFLQEADKQSTTGRMDSSRGQPDAGAQPPSSAPAVALPVVTPAREDLGQGFKALDDLFQSTAAKPKLYYLPSSERFVKARLDKLDTAGPHSKHGGRGSSRDEEKRRFTFEDEILVDDGPEFRPGYRGAPGVQRGRGNRFGAGGFSAGRSEMRRGDSYRG